jgi:hypothetical protein
MSLPAREAMGVEAAAVRGDRLAFDSMWVTATNLL